MQIEYNFDFNDWMAFQKSYFLGSKQFKKNKLIVQLTLPVMFAALILVMLLNENFESPGTFFIGYAVVVNIIWVIWYPKRYVKRSLKRMRKMLESGDNSGYLGRHVLTFGEEGFTYVNNATESRIKWSGIKKVQEAPDHFYLYDTAVSAIIIPKQKIGDQVTEVAGVLKSRVGASEIVNK